MKDKLKPEGQPASESAEPRQRIAKLEALERRHAMMEHRLRDSEVRYRRLFETAQDGILILDAKTGQITDVNPFLIEMLGYSKTEFLGKRLWEIGPFRDIEAAKTAFAELQSKGYIRYADLPLETKDRRRIAVEFVSNVYPVNSNKVIQCNIRDITQRRKAEVSLQATYRFLEISNRHTNMTPMLHEFIAEVKNMTGCAAVGIRILDDEGNIPYQAYEGFSQTFYDSESPLSIKSDQCMCINVVTGKTDATRSYYTEGGSFYMNSTTRFLATIPEKERGQTRNVCNEYGYESVALVPIHIGNSILGLIQVADSRERMVPLETVQLLEKAAMVLGEAVQRVRLAQAVNESEERFRTIYEKSPIGIAIFDSDGVLLTANGAALDIMGATETAKGISFSADPNLTDDLRRRLAGAETIQTEVVYNFEAAKKRKLYDTRRTGVVQLGVSATPLGVSRGKHSGGYLVQFQDITQRRRLDELKDEFIGLVSHELRTPLTVIMGALNVLVTEETRLSSEEKRSLLLDAVAEAEDLSRMLTNLLELARAQAGRLLLHAESVSIDTVVKDAVEKIKQRYPSREFRADLPKRLPRVNADILRVEHILNNLLENAVKYSPRGSEIRVFAKQANRDITIGVSDQGIGIAISDQAKLFMPFERAVNGALDAIKGTGLGLLVCRRLAEAHGGRIWVESDPGRGSTFFFTLPLGQKEP